MNDMIRYKIDEAISLMADETSRTIYLGQAYYNLTGDYAYIAKMLRALFVEHRDCIRSQALIDVFTRLRDDLENLNPLTTFRVDRDNMFFEPCVVSLKRDEVFIDCGATDMGVSIEFAYNTGDSFKRIVAFDPDPVCAEMCRDNLQYFSKEKRKDVLFFDCGLSDREGTAPLERGLELGNSRIAANGGENMEKIQIKRLDDIKECKDATFIKAHVEGAAADALRGAKNIITKNKPLIAVSCYHNLSELLEIPFFLKRLVPEYSLYMRHYSTGTSESVLYAVPPKRG